MCSFARVDYAAISQFPFNFVWIARHIMPGPAVTPMIPAAITVSKALHNSSDEEAHPEHLMAHTTRKARVVNRLCAGSTISHWSEQHLERMIKTNNVFQEHQDQLRQKMEELKAEFEPLTKLMKEVLGAA